MMQRYSHSTHGSIYQGTSLAYEVNDYSLYVIHWEVDSDSGSWYIGIDFRNFLYEKAISLEAFQLPND